MSLDVPCGCSAAFVWWQLLGRAQSAPGTNFNVIACDTFSVQDGKLKMVRRLAAALRVAWPFKLLASGSAPDTRS